VQVDGNASPWDKHYQDVYGDPNHRAYMTAGAAGVITIYPSAVKQTQQFMNSSFIHETGHTLSLSRWGNADTDPRWDAYEAAIQSDGFVTSNYAREHAHEDFSETLVLYQKVRGTPEEAEVRALMPGRFRLIDELLAAPARTS
jgi:hypothetical protein